MIRKQAITDFLNRDLVSWTWLKETPKDYFIEEFEKLYSDFTFKFLPFEHQWAAFFAGMYNNGFLYFLDMGTGKTKISLDLARFWRYRGMCQKVLVVCERLIHLEEWKNEIKLHAPEFSYTQLYGTKKEREKLLHQDTDVHIINYAGLNSLFSEKRIKESSRDKLKKKPSNARIDEIASKYDMVIFDEIHNIKNTKSLAYKISKRLVRGIRFRYGLTGTPFGRDPHNLWSLFYLVDDGETLGETKELFKTSFFNEKYDFYGGVTLTVKKKLEKQFHERLGVKSLHYDETECNDLPPKSYHRIRLKMPPEIRGAYNLAVDGFNNEGDKLKKRNCFIKLRQISSGFSVYENEEGEKKTIFFDNNVKLEALESIVDNIPEDKKVLIFCEFQVSGKMISELFKKKKIKHLRLYSGTKDKIKTMNSFKTDKSIRCLVANSISGGTGVNLQSVVNYVLFYESPVSVINRRQAEKRAHRTGQKNRVHIYDFIYDFICNKSVDEVVLGLLQEGVDLRDSVLRGKIKRVGSSEKIIKKKLILTKRRRYGK